MCVQIGLLIESLVTTFEAAEEGFLPSVNPQVCLEVEVKGKFLSAEFTLIRFLAL